MAERMTVYSGVWALATTGHIGLMVVFERLELFPELYASPNCVFCFLWIILVEQIWFILNNLRYYTPRFW